jgi:hypothetical protein
LGQRRGARERKTEGQPWQQIHLRLLAARTLPEVDAMVASRLADG